MPDYEASEPVEGVITGIIIAPGERAHYATRDFDTLDSLQAAVGGLIQLVHLDADTVMFINEEGKNQDLPPNPVATRLLAAAGGMPGDWVAGSALLTGITSEGDATFVPRHWLTAFPD